MRDFANSYCLPFSNKKLKFASLAYWATSCIKYTSSKLDVRLINIFRFFKSHSPTVERKLILCKRR